MAGPVRTHQFANTTLGTGTGPTVLYTVPAGRRAVVKYFSAFHVGGDDPALLQLYIAGAGGAVGILATVQQAEGLLLERFEVYAVANEGEEIVANVGGAGGGSSFFHVGGVLFEV